MERSYTLLLSLLAALIALVPLAGAAGLGSAAVQMGHTIENTSATISTGTVVLVSLGTPFTVRPSGQYLINGNLLIRIDGISSGTVEFDAVRGDAPLQDSSNRTAGLYSLSADTSPLSIGSYEIALQSVSGDSATLVAAGLGKTVPIPVRQRVRFGERFSLQKGQQVNVNDAFTLEVTDYAIPIDNPNLAAEATLGIGQVSDNASSVMIGVTVPAGGSTDYHHYRISLLSLSPRGDGTFIVEDLDQGNGSVAVDARLNIPATLSPGVTANYADAAVSVLYNGQEDGGCVVSHDMRTGKDTTTCGTLKYSFTASTGVVPVDAGSSPSTNRVGMDVLLSPGETTSVFGHALTLVRADGSQVVIILSDMPPVLSNTTIVIPSANSTTGSCPAGCEASGNGCVCRTTASVMTTAQGYLLRTDDAAVPTAVKQIMIEPGAGSMKALVADQGDVMIPSANGQGVALAVPFGKSSVSIATDDARLETYLSDNGTTAVTRETVVASDSGLSLSTTSGTLPVKVTPSAAAAKVQAALSVPVANVELTATGNQARYNAQVQKKVRLFGFIPVEATYRASVNAETGAVVSVEKPWYAALSTE